MARRRWLGGLLCLLGVLSSGAAVAQGFRWPEKPENLKVLPHEVGGRELGKIMRGFASALGVRCQHCHAARQGQTLDPMDLTTFDFASDANPTKEKARLMIQMVGAINGTYLSRLDVPDQERLEVTCVTCHRGLEKPRPLGEVLARVLDSEGIEAAVQRYQALRQQYYGQAAYDFGPGVLGALGERLTDEGRLEAAIRILALENEQNPDFAYGHFLSATAREKAGDHEAALAHMQKAVDLAPAGQKAFFSRALEKMQRDHDP